MVALRDRDPKLDAEFREAFGPDSGHSDYAKGLIWHRLALGRVIPTRTWAWLDTVARSDERWAKQKLLNRFWRRCDYCPLCGLPYVHHTVAGEQPFGLPGWRISTFRSCNPCRARRAITQTTRAKERLSKRLASLRAATAEKLKSAARTNCVQCGESMTSLRASRAYCSTRCRVAAFRAKSTHP